MKRKPLVCKLQDRLPLLVVILCLIQPIMDVLSYWTGLAGLNNFITLLLRLYVLAAVVAVGFCLSQRKWVWFAAAGVLLLLTLGHAVVCFHYGYQDPIGDLTNLVRIYHMPLVTLSVITCIRRNKRCVDGVKWGFLSSFCVILLVELLATVTNTDPHTYANKAIGVLGWFSMPSAQSAILSMVVPVAIVCVMERKKFHPVFTAGVGVIGLGTLWLFATRLSYAALLGCAFCLAAACLLLRFVKKENAGKAAVIFAALGVLALVLFGVSPMNANNEKVAETALQKQEDILLLVQTDREQALADGLSGTALETASLKSAYEKYLYGVMARFGLERVAECYGYSYHVSDLSNTRLQKLNYCRMLMEEQPLTCLFGIELYDLTCNDMPFDAENDFHGIYYLCGGVGLALLVAMIVFFLAHILRGLLLNFKSVFTLPAVGFAIAMICGLVHAYFTAGVLRRPNSNFYLGAIFAVLYVLTEVKKPVRTTEENKE